MTTELNAIAFKAQTHPKHRFQNLFGTLKEGALHRAWLHLNKKSAAGIDGIDAAPLVPVVLGAVVNEAVLDGKVDHGDWGAARRAQAESARASGALAVRTPTVDAQCEVGDEADRSGGALAIVAGSGGRVGLACWS